MIPMPPVSANELELKMLVATTFPVHENWLLLSGDLPYFEDVGSEYHAPTTLSMQRRRTQAQQRLGGILRQLLQLLRCARAGH